MEKINERIELLYDRDHLIGHAYFHQLHDDPTVGRLARIFKNNIIPLLEEYFFEEPDKIRLVLGDHGKPENLQFIKRINAQTAYDALLGANGSSLPHGSVRDVYRKQPGALAAANAGEPPGLARMLFSWKRGYRHDWTSTSRCVNGTFSGFGQCAGKKKAYDTVTRCNDVMSAFLGGACS